MSTEPGKYESEVRRAHEEARKNNSEVYGFESVPEDPDRPDRMPQSAALEFADAVRLLSEIDTNNLKVGLVLAGYYVTKDDGSPDPARSAVTACMVGKPALLIPALIEMVTRVTERDSSLVLLFLYHQMKAWEKAFKEGPPDGTSASSLKAAQDLIDRMMNPEGHKNE